MRETMAVLKRIVMYYPANYAAVFLLRLVGFAGLGLLSGVLVKKFFDEAANGSMSFHSLGLTLLILIVVPLVQAAGYYLDLSLSYGWVEIIRAYFRRNILRELLAKPGCLPLPTGHGQLINVLRKDAAVHEGVLWDSTYLAAYAVFSLAGFIVIGWSHWMAAAVLLVPLVLVFFMVQWLERLIAANYFREQQATDRVLGVLSDMFNYSQALKLNGAEDAFLNRLLLLGKERARAGRRNDAFKAVLTSTYDNIVNIGIALLLLVMGYGIRDGSLSVGSIALFMLFMGYVAGFTRLFGTCFANVKSSKAALERMKAVIGDDDGAARKLTCSDSLFLTEQPHASWEVEKDSMEALNAVEVRDLSYTHPNGTEGIRDMSLSLQRGSLTVLTGRMGSGKTTLLRVLLGLLPKESGTVRWNGRPVDDAANFFVPPCAAYMPQAPYLFSETIKENILLGCPDVSRLDEAVQLSVLDEDIRRFEQGLDTPIGTKGVRLSGGQQQRVAAARMLVRDAELLVIDDMSSALDAETEARLWERLEQLRRSRSVTLLVVSHKPHVWQAADHIIVMEGGRPKAQGTLEQVEVWLHGADGNKADGVKDDREKAARHRS